MSSKHALFASAVMAVVGCDTPGDKARVAHEARMAADQKVADIVETAERKEHAVQEKANQDEAQIRREAKKKIGEADLGADRRANEATQALWAAREQARAGSSTRLDGLDRDILALKAPLEKKLSTAGAATVVQELQGKAAAVRKSIADLDQCSADDLESVKRSIKTGFDDLDLALADAKKRA